MTGAVHTAVPELQTTTRRRTLGPQARWILILGLAGLFGLWVGSQYLAYRFAYHPNLGPSLLGIPVGLRGYALAAACGCMGTALFFLFRRGRRAFAIPLVTAGAVLSFGSLGPFYGPFQFIRWAGVYRRIPELAPIISDGILVVAASMIAAATSMLVLLSRSGQRRASSSHGSARWGTGAGLHDPVGLLIGRSVQSGELLCFNAEGHLLTLAPTRSGKGVSAVIPNLLDYPGSVVVLDVKPENAAVAARRRREMGQEVRIMDP